MMKVVRQVTSSLATKALMVMQIQKETGLLQLKTSKSQTLKMHLSLLACRRYKK
jgi:hypothetical protein